MNPVEIYIENSPKEVKGKLRAVQRLIQEIAPGAEEVINYGIPTFKLNGNLVHYSANKNHIGFYPTPSAIEAFKSEIQKYKHSKGSVQFSIEKPLPLDLIRRMVEFRVKEAQKA